MPQAFTHTHYLPILKGKRGEFEALRKLQPQVTAALTPIIEIPAVDWDWENDVARKLEADHVRAGLDGMVKAWGTARPFFLDPATAGLTTPVVGDPSNRHPYTFVFDEARTRGLLAVPVVALAPDAATLAAVQAIAAVDGRGIMVRVERERLTDPSIFPLLTALPTLWGRPPAEIDLLLDYEDIPTAALPGYIMGLPQWLPHLPHLPTWRTFTIAGCGMPESLGGLSAGVIHSVPRTEWALWKALRHHVGGRSRVPTFSDYGIAYVDVAELDPRLMKPLHNMRYTIANEWLVIRGQNVRTGQGMRTPQMCQILRAHPAFCGPGFSAGDAYIDNCAVGLAKPGNMTTWREVGTNHHLTYVVWQLASLSAISTPAGPAPGAGQGPSIP